MTWKKILCPVDFSDGSRSSMEAAVKLAIESNAPIVLAHVWYPPVVFASEPIGLPASMVSDLVATTERNLTAWKRDAEALGAPKVTTALLQGAPWHELVAYAKSDPEIDLIVVGTHGRTGIKHALLGSVAEKVVRHARCPVLVVRAE
jgi:nucleotide-binding universal stress UspA family protein